MEKQPLIFLNQLLQPNPRRFLALWYTAWLGYGIKGFVVNWLIRRQPIRIAWVPVTGSVETVYLLAEIIVVAAIVWQAWRFERANWRLAFLYEGYSLVEISLSLFNPHLWTYALNHMWCSPVNIFGQMYQSCQPVVWSQAPHILASHLGFIAFYAFMHHGLPLLMLMKVRLEQEVSDTFWGKSV